MSTTTTGVSDALAGRAIRKSSGLLYKAIFLKITLPDLSGDVVSAAELQLNATYNAGPMNNINVHALSVSDSGAWDNSSTVGTLDALTLGTAVQTGLTLSSGTGTKTFDILGDATKGIQKFYADNPTGGDCTICLQWSAFSGTANGALATLSIGDDDVGSPEATFSTYNDATYYARVQLTHAALVYDSYEIEAPGNFRFLETFTIDAPGKSNLVLIPITIQAPGARSQLVTFTIEAPGKHDLALIHVVIEAPGLNKQYRTYTPEARGVANILNSFLLDAVGRYNIVGSFTIEAPGAAQYGRGFVIEAPGVANLAAFIYERVYRQVYRVADASLERWELYLGEDAMPDFEDGGQPVATATSLPFTHSVTPPGSGTTVLYAIVRKRNAYGLLSFNQHPKLREIDTNGDEVLGPLTAPELARVLDGTVVGGLQAWARYPWEGDRNPADYWELYAESGVDPDPDTDTPVYMAAMGIPGGAGIPWHGMADGLIPGTTYHVAVAVRRSADNAYALSSVIQITIAEVYDLDANDTTIFGGEQYEAKQ